MNRIRKQTCLHPDSPPYPRTPNGSGEILHYYQKQKSAGEIPLPIPPRTLNGSGETFIIEKKKCRRDKAAMVASGALDN